MSAVRIRDLTIYTRYRDAVLDISGLSLKAFSSYSFRRRKIIDEETNNNNRERKGKLVNKDRVGVFTRSR